MDNTPPLEVPFGMELGRGGGRERTAYLGLHMLLQLNPVQGTWIKYTKVTENAIREMVLRAKEI